MLRRILRRISRGRNGQYREIDPEDIFLDAVNLPGYAEHRFEGRIERPIDHRTFFILRVALALMMILLGGKLWTLAVTKGEVYKEISENNRLGHTVIFANRGVILDRNGKELAANAIKEDDSDFSRRSYPPIEGMSHLVGYLKYPQKDSAGVYYQENYRGADGAEKYYDEILAGKNGLKLRETDALGNIISESVIDKPEDGKPLTLSIDARVNVALQKALKSIVTERGFVGGAGVVMDVRNGEILALTSFPEYNQNILSLGKDRGAINAFLKNSKKPFLNRTISGLYTPGSIIKPILALAALNEGLISPDKKILSTGSISIANPYDPSKPSIFRDWKAHGWTDMSQALAVSSDTYFYAIGGGYQDQRGLGIEKIDQYLNLFGITEKTNIDLPGEARGLVPTPEWKSKVFNGDIWRLGDTYITSIGQFGTQMTPLEAVRFVSAIANKGRLLNPSILIGGTPYPERKQERTIEFQEDKWQEIHAGMRKAVTMGTAQALNMPNLKVAAKTGTAEVGTAKALVHSWVIGFLPYENPKYAFAVVMERGPSKNNVGASWIMREVLEWMTVNAPHYLDTGL